MLASIHSSQRLPRTLDPSRCPFITPSRSICRSKESCSGLPCACVIADDCPHDLGRRNAKHHAAGWPSMRIGRWTTDCTAQMRNGRPARATFVVIRPPPLRPRCCCATINGGRQDCAKLSSSLSPPIRVCARAGRPPTPR